MLLIPRHPISPNRKRLALAVAGLADFLQIAGWWAFIWGGASPADDILDVLVAAALLLVVGLRWQLAIAFIAELVPGMALFPTWTAFILAMPTQRDDNPPITRVPPVQNADGAPPPHERPQLVSRVPPRIDMPPDSPDAR